ncbi:ribokinase [Aidingimonas lacisalsi]|uniref:ribokinase n=1 Tax=Aidingimonas lacisalsi TaxID=2604086 RepID=UPI0011D21ADF|nr:ribokinase [Aidingimonas lacisalsi]
MTDLVQQPLFNLGSINIDHIYRVPHLVRPGETLSSTSYRQVLGGKGANQSLAIARAGGDVTHWGRLNSGDDWARDILATSGVKTRDIVPVDEPSGHALIQVDDDGENAIILYPGANHGFSECDIDRWVAMAPAQSWLLLQNECNGLAHIMKRAHEHGLSIAFNPAPMTAAVHELPLDTCSVLFVNRGEAASLAGMSDNAGADELLDALACQLPEVEIVLTLGAAGVCYQHGTQRFELPAHEVVAVDTTAAGDTFIGYFMASRQVNETIEHCLQRASVASALCVQQAGAAPSIPSAVDVDDAFADWDSLVTSASHAE